MKDNQWWKYMECKPSEDKGELDLTSQIEALTKQKKYLQDQLRKAGQEIQELKRDNTLLAHDNATQLNRLREGGL